MTKVLDLPALRTRHLLELLGTGKRLVVMTHNNPDPDSLASAMGLRLLAEQVARIPSCFAMRGDILRAENKAMVRLLQVDMVSAATEPIVASDLIALVDTQPGFGHTVVPQDHPVDIVVDHHEGPREAGHAPPRFVDLRIEAGATSSIVASYLMESGVEVPARVATALFYGIRTDTADLARNASPLDEKAYHFLAPRIDRRIIAEISNPDVPVDYFRALRKAMNTTRIYGHVVLCSLGATENPEMVAEVADLLLRLEGKTWVIAGGLYRDTYYVSVRTDGMTGREAWHILADAIQDVGSFGGHGAVAGGRVKLATPSPRALGRLERKLQKRILESLGVAHLPPTTLA